MRGEPRIGGYVCQGAGGLVVEHTGRGGLSGGEAAEGEGGVAHHVCGQGEARHAGNETVFRVAFVKVERHFRRLAVSG